MPKLSRYISHETDIKADAIVFHEGDRPKLDDTSSQQQFGLNKLREVCLWCDSFDSHGMKLSVIFWLISTFKLSRAIDVVLKF